MEWSLWLAFFSASLFLAFVPGPDNIFVMLQSAAYGVRSGLFVILGLCTGLVFQTLCATLGLAAVVAASQWLFAAICIAGALYLLWLAKGAWFAPVSDGGGDGSTRVQKLSNAAAWRRGTIMNITNPKVQIFFLAFFPQFIYRGSEAWPVWMQMLVMGVTFMLATLLVFSAVAFGAGYLSSNLRSARSQLLLNRISAVIFVILAFSSLWQIFTEH